MKRPNLETDRYHGRIVTVGPMRGSRWCEQHQCYHGIIYPCRWYPAALRNRIHRGWKGIANDADWQHWQVVCYMTGESPKRSQWWGWFAEDSDPCLFPRK